MLYTASTMNNKPNVPEELAPESVLPPSAPPLELDVVPLSVLPLSVPASATGVEQVPWAAVVEEQICPGVQPLPPVPRQPFKHFLVAVSQTLPLVAVPQSPSTAQFATHAPAFVSQKTRPPLRPTQSAAEVHLPQLPSPLQ